MSLIENINNVLEKLYGNNEHVILQQLVRYNKLFDTYTSKFNKNEIFLFSTPGRIEISGNHTDHNLGRVIASSINLDSLAVISSNDDNRIILYSEGYENSFELDLNNLEKVKQEEGTTNSLIRGIVARFKQLGYNIGGFEGVITSDVLPGSGLSSSASIEVLLGNILSSLYNSNQIVNEELAKIGQWAENNYFGKPCGLMDQMACAIGGIISIDFENPLDPLIELVDFEFENEDYKVLILDTGGNHIDLTDEYASVPKEMKAVANYLGKEVCREIDFNLFLEKLPEIREQLGDRVLLRVYHFFTENSRVLNQIESLKKNNFNEFLKYVSDSGNSSFKYLQNVYSNKEVKEQGVSLALALTEKFISENGKGACRVHGGGFGGTILAFLPNEQIDSYKKMVEPIFGQGKLMILNIRKIGTICLNNL